MFDHQNDVLSNFTKYRFPNHLFPVVSPSSSHYMVVSWNRGTSKSYILMGFSIINQPFLDTPICGNPHITIFHHYSPAIIHHYSPLLRLIHHYYQSPHITIVPHWVLRPRALAKTVESCASGAQRARGNLTRSNLFIYTVYIYIYTYVCMYVYIYIYMYVCNVM